MFSRTNHFLRTTGILGALLFPSTVSAATPGDTDLIRERQDRLLEEQSRRLEDLKNLPGQSGNPVTPSAPNDERCFPISSIDLKGADSLSSAERQRLLTPFTGQCLGVAQLDLLLKTITDHYLDKGLVTSRAYLPQQDLSSGALQVLVVEGRLERVRSAEDSELSERELAMSFPGKPGDLLNLREIEQMVDQLNRLPSNNAKMELAPGERIGGSEVLVRNTRQKPWRVGLSRHNDGQASTGEQQWGPHSIGTAPWACPINCCCAADMTRSAIARKPRTTRCFATVCRLVGGTSVTRTAKVNIARRFRPWVSTSSRAVKARIISCTWSG